MGIRTASFVVLGLAIAAAVACACGSSSDDSTFGSGGTSGAPGSSGVLPGGDAGPGGCNTKTCAELGWACGYTVDACGKVTNCADEGRACAANEVCVGGIDAPTKCVAGAAGTCDVCAAIPACTGTPQKTKLTGRVITGGRDDGNTKNQVGVPNAIVYIPRNSDPAALPPVSSGIPAGGTSCDRCDQQDLGPVVAGAITDATGTFVIEGNVPVGKEFLLVVKAGKFRRATKQTIPANAACTTTTLLADAASNPTRLPRNSTDGLAVNLPRVAISTGQIDAIECVFEKMGVAHPEFGDPGTDGKATPRVHLYRGGLTAPGAGAVIDASTPFDTALYGDVARLENYDIVVADCEGPTWDAGFTQRNANGGNVREYVNRGGRLFASHLSFSWLDANGTAAYDAANPVATGLDAASTWETKNLDTSSVTGTGVIATGTDRPRRSPHIQNFYDWMVSEKVVTSPSTQFPISQPRSQADTLGASSEEFVYQSDGNKRTQQFSFNTPYAAPDTAACGRVAYSGFHVVAAGGASDPYANVTFPNHCTGDLSDQEKVLLYMLFDVSACVGGSAEAPACTPLTCSQAGAVCGYTPDGCGNLLDCGACQAPK